ncbi:MAG: DUF3256 family protein [Candidatus Amulumruptor caecigallinarius]|nr:DUF3256 family protein [Candidatus Amulumruptor caecigallinarius]
MKKRMYMPLAAMFLTLTAAISVSAGKEGGVDAAQPEVDTLALDGGSVIYPDSVNPAAIEEDVTNDLSASDAFIRMPAQVLDLLTNSMRLDMLDLYGDPTRKVMNTMEGYSSILHPLTPDYLKASLTPVSTLEIKILKYKKFPLVVAVYTVGDTLTAYDSDIRFYSRNMKELPREKFIKIAELKDFIRPGVSRAGRDSVLDAIPFPTVEYLLSPDSATLEAHLTVSDYLGREQAEKVSPLLLTSRRYQWDGKKFKMEKI